MKAEEMTQNRLNFLAEKSKISQSQFSEGSRMGNGNLSICYKQDQIPTRPRIHENFRVKHCKKRVNTKTFLTVFPFLSFCSFMEDRLLFHTINDHNVCICLSKP